MDALEALLARHPGHSAQEEPWGASRMRVSEHLGASLPPDELTTSVRAVVLVASHVLVVHDPHTLHILIRHLTPRPPAYHYPYPSFLHVIYAAPGLRCRPEARKPDDYVQDARLVPATEAQALPLPPEQLPFLAVAQAALQQLT